MMFILMVFTISDTEITLITAMSGAVKITDFFWSATLCVGLSRQPLRSRQGKAPNLLDAVQDHIYERQSAHVSTPVLI
jgi:hypothetical protein